MEELEIQGKIYISAKRAHELTGYAKDYIGQLARAGKVAGTRVGRAWYVDQTAILAMSGEEKAVAPPITALTPSNDVLSVPKAGNYQTIPSIKLIKTGNDLKTSTWGSIKFTNDSSELLPPLIKIVPSSSMAPGISSKNIANPVTRIQESSKVISKQPSFNDGVIPKQRVQKNAYLAPIPQKNDKFRPLAGGLAIVLVAIILLIVQKYASSSWVLSNTGGYAGVVPNNNNLLFGYFLDLFNQGVGLIHSYIVLIFESLPNFFNTGLIYISKILHLG